MALLFHRCTGCRRVLSQSERDFLDDPQAPFGPEWVCPECDSLVTLQANPALIALVAVLSVLLVLGCLMT